MSYKSFGKGGCWLNHSQQSINSFLKKNDTNAHISFSLTYELYCLLEVRTDVGQVAVLHRDPLVVKVALGRLQVPARHVEQGRDVKVTEIVVSRSVIGTAEVEERQNLYRCTLERTERETERDVRDCSTQDKTPPTPSSLDACACSIPEGRAHLQIE